MSSIMDRRYAVTSEKNKKRGCLIGTPIGLAISVSMVIMGATHLDKCPAERYIPIFLLVSGSFSIAVMLIRAFLQCKQHNPSRRLAALQATSGVFSLFLTAWFIAGNVWIYRLHNNYSPDPGAPNYCDNTFYLYSFWLITALYIFMGISVLISCCFCICLMVCSCIENDDHKDINDKDDVRDKEDDEAHLDDKNKDEHV